MKMEQTECSEMLAYKSQTPGNYPDESIQLLIFTIYFRANLHKSVEKYKFHLQCIKARLITSF